MDTRTIARLAEIMGQHNLSELEVEEAGLHIHLHRGLTAAPEAPSAVALEEDSPCTACDGAKAPADDAAGTVVITSPLVGTYYASASPEAKPFVQEGSLVKAGMTVCIIEAMKVMNEVKAEADGIITKVCKTNKSAVEYGCPLFEMKVSD